MINLAILGYGTVGTGLLDIIAKNNVKNEEDEGILITSILVKNIEKHTKKEFFSVVTDDIEYFFSKPIDVLVEVMGGVHPAYDYVKKAITSGKHVVTANKDLIAEHGKELLNLAKENKVTLNFEASVGGGIPILKPLIECLSGNEIFNIKAILNGTTNFILTKMFNENMSYAEALEIAQELGFAELNPESDVMGYDAARKLAILSTIAYKQLVNWSEINIEGIVDLEPIDFEYARRNNCCIKLVAMSNQCDEGIFACVKPMLVPVDSSLGKTENEFNAINIEGDYVGEVMFYGKGAGMSPTASSVYGDLVDILKNRKKSLEFSSKEGKVIKTLNTDAEYMFRINTEDTNALVKYISKEFKDRSLQSLNCEGNYIVGFVKCENELDIISRLSNISLLPYVKSTKQILKL